MTNEVKKEEVGYVINRAADLGNGNQLSITGNLPKGATLEMMNAEFDKLGAAFNRLQAKAASKGANDEIEQLILRQKAAIDDLERVDARGASKGGLSTEERRQRELAVSTIERMSKDLEFKQDVLERLLEESK
jgi:hypothetical protein